MDYISRIALLASIFVICHASCVDDKKQEMMTCFNALKSALASENPKDLNVFMCSEAQKERLNCVIKHFTDCPDFMSESFVDDLQYPAANFHARDLFYIQSADQFCKCAPTLTCLENIETEQMYIKENRSSWSKMADPSYICGLGRNYIDCVAKSLPTCTTYLQFKYNESMEGSPVDFQVSSLEYAGIFAENRCKMWPDDANKHNCSKKRSGWYSVEICYNQAANLMDAKDRKCGMRKCIERAMVTCPPPDMDYFIDAANVFAEHRIETQPCALSSSSMVTMTTANFLVLLFSLVVLL